MNTFEFQKLPIIVQKQIIAEYALEDEMGLENVEGIKELAHLFQHPHVEDLYRILSEKRFAQDVLNFKENNMTWQDFYFRMLRLIELKNNYNLNMIKYHLENNNLMEVKFILAIKKDLNLKSIFNEDLLIYSLRKKNYDIAEFLINYGIYTHLDLLEVYNYSRIFDLLEKKRIDLIKLFVSKNMITDFDKLFDLVVRIDTEYANELVNKYNLIPTQQNVNSYLHGFYVEALEYIYKTFGMLPTVEKGYTTWGVIAQYGNAKVLEWCFQHNIYPPLSEYRSAMRHNLTKSDVRQWYMNHEYLYVNEFIDIITKEDSGFDLGAQQNLQRNSPQTYKVLKDRDWFNKKHKNTYITF